MSPPTSAGQGLVALDKVTYAYPTHGQVPVLDQIDLEVRTSEYLLICGASGSGKSTLVRTFNGLIPHFYGGRLSGAVYVDGQSTQNSSVADLFDQVAMVFQNPQAQLFNRTVAQELVFGLESLGLPRDQMKARMAAVAAEMDLEALLDRNPQTLSGGEQQMVAIASVLVLQPRIVVLDEPMANLDASHVGRLKALLVRLKRQGIGIVVCEHRLVPTLADADRVVVVQQGHVLLEGSPRQVVVDPRWPEREIDLPLAVRIGRQIGQQPLPLTMETLRPAGHDPDGYGLAGHRSAPVVFQGEPLVSVEQVGLELHGRKIIENVTFGLHAGQCVALVGANGAGKTTLLKLINGLLKPSCGRIRINGRDSADLRAWQVARQVGTAFQNPNSQFFKLTVEEEILVGPMVQKRYDRHWIDELVSIFRLDHLMGRAPFKLSGGEKKRAAFAAALAAKPAVLALDEPTAGQDSQFRQALIHCLQRLKNQGTAILLVTHALNFVESIADRWLVMAQGCLIADGTPWEVMAQADIMNRAGLAPTEAYQWRMKDL